MICSCLNEAWSICYFLFCYQEGLMVLETQNKTWERFKEVFQPMLDGTHTIQ